MLQFLERREITAHSKCSSQDLHVNICVNVILDISSPVLCQLHWLPIEEDMVFKILSVTSSKCFQEQLSATINTSTIAKYVPR